VREAHEARETAPWYRAWAAARAVHATEQELADLEASAPPPVDASSAFAQRLLADLQRPSKDVGGPR